MTARTIDDILGPVALLEAGRALYAVVELGVPPEDIPPVDWANLAPDPAAITLARHVLGAVHRALTADAAALLARHPATTAEEDELATRRARLRMAGRNR